MIPLKEKILLTAIGIFFTVLAVWVVAAVVAAPPQDTKNPSAPNIGCTEEAKLCPDGSAVGRIGPNCEFAPCPPSMPPPVPGETQPVTPGPKPAPAPIGGDSDTHGCKGSAGYSWCEAKQKCLRSWEEECVAGVACTMEAKQCPDGSYVGRTPPTCEFTPCPTPTPAPTPVSGTSGSCTSDSDCAPGYSCEDISPVVREGTQNLRCWKNGAPRPICLSGETHIATPNGDILVKNMKGGEVVWSINAKGEKIAAPVLVASHTQARTDHHVVHLVLTDGRELFVSPGHPVADGRTAGSLKAGDRLDGSMITTADLVPYHELYTYDILPDSDTGMYIANGILLQSTLKK